MHQKLCAPKVAGVPVVGIFALPLGSPETKNHLDVTPVERRRVYYKGEGGGFPQVRAMMSLVSPSCSWFVLAPKVFQLCTNRLVLVLCRFVWIIEACQFFLVPSWSSSMPLYPSKVLRVKEWPRLLALPLFSIWDSRLSPSRSWERVTHIARLFGTKLPLKQNLFALGFWVFYVKCQPHNKPFATQVFLLQSFGLSNCLLKRNFHIFQAKFLHAHTHLNFIHGILTCLWHNISKKKANKWLR